MSDKKIIAVVGATGAQGGGLVKAILNDKSSEFAVRAITRDVNSDKAKELATLGAELVQADVDNFESIKNAFHGVYGAFCVTFFWHHFSPEKELETAKTMADAAKAAGVKHVIWSTLEDTRQWVPLSDESMPTLMGKYKVPHFDSKGEADSYFSKIGLPVTNLRTSFYWDNFIYFGLGPKKGPDGNFSITLPMENKKLPGIAAEDIGKCAFGVFKNPGETIGKTIGIAGEFLTGSQMADAMSGALGVNVGYNYVPPEIYRGFGFPGAEDMGNMFQFKRDFEDVFCGNRDINFARKLNPELQNFGSWISANASKIPLE
jgi:uncharacterized protein YbjT (DUF2867 family)